MANRSSRLRSFIDTSVDGFEHLESRRMLDAASMLPSVFPEGSPEADYEIDMDETGDQPGDDADMYLFTTRPDAERPRDTMQADEPGDDHDLYDFGQDRGEDIDDDAAYEAGDEVAAAVPAGPIASDLSGAPNESDIDSDTVQVEVADLIAPLEEPVAIALIPAEPGISWLGGTAGSVVSIGTDADADSQESPASWTDLAALPEVMTIAQP